MCPKNEFSLPGARAGSYWTSFFPGIVVLSLGMAASVAPLTTTVMGAVEEHQAGVASGVNNTVSRAAGLLAIAVFGVLMARAFDASLERRIAALPLPAEARAQLEEGRGRLADVRVPDALDDETKAAVRNAVGDSFVAGFRRVTRASAALAALSAVSAWLLIGGRGNGSDREKESTQTNLRGGG